MESTLPDSINDVTVEEIQCVSEIENTVSESITQSLAAQQYVEDLQDEIHVYAAPLLAAAEPSRISFNDSDLIFSISFNNTDMRVLFPENMREYLVVRDGVLVNTYGSTIVGLVLDSDDSAETTTFHDRFLSLYPFTSTSGNQNAYRYGGYAYLTTYRVSTSTALAYDTTYGNALVTEKPALFRGFSQFELIIMFCAALLVITNFFGGIFRR